MIPLTSYRISVQTLGSVSYPSSPDSGKFAVATVDYAAPKTINTVSTITNAASNPTILVTGNDFKSKII